MFGITTPEKLPEACKTQQAAWDELISTIWYTLFTLHGLPRDGTIIEIGPGTSAKIGLALSKCNFRGELYIIDSCPKSLEILKTKYASCLIGVKIHYHESPIQDCLKHLPQEPEYLLASHVLDDMIIAKMVESLPSMKKKAVLEWSTYNNTYALETSNAFKREWEALARDEKRLTSIKKNIAGYWITILQTLNPQRLILSQYPSATLTENGLDSLNKHAEEVFRDLCTTCSLSLEKAAQVQDLLNTLPHYNNAHLGNHILNGRNWMVYKRK